MDSGALSVKVSRLITLPFINGHAIVSNRLLSAQAAIPCSQAYVHITLSVTVGFSKPVHAARVRFGDLAHLALTIPHLQPLYIYTLPAYSPPYT